MDGLLCPECGCPEVVVYDDGTCECKLRICVLVKTEDIHPPKTGISVHFCVLSLMAMQK